MNSIVLDPKISELISFVLKLQNAHCLLPFNNNS